MYTWILSKDFLPTNDNYVLTWSSWMTHPMILFYSKGYGWGGKNLIITHWMKLPDIPKIK